jgi:hypothetical protein
MSSESLSAVPMGQRVTIRHRLADGRASDSVGRITARDDSAVTLHTRRGEVRVPLDAVLVFRVVHSVPWRIGRFLSRAEVAVLGLGTVLHHVGPTELLLHDLRDADVPVYVLGADADAGTARLEQGGLGHLVAQLLGAGADDSTPGSYAAAHAQIEERLQRTVRVGMVHFTDEGSERVAGAREFGWQARIFTPPDEGPVGSGRGLG